MDEQIATFTAFTGGTPEQAQRFLELTDGNAEQAVELFFNSPDLGNASAAAGAAPSAPSPPSQTNREAPITIDDSDDEDMTDVGGGPGGVSVEDDEALARRLQAEMYEGTGRSGQGAGDFGEEEVRAPMARTTETLVGPGSDWRDDPARMNAATADQVFARENRRARAAPGIFNQREAASIWSQDDPSNPEIHRQTLARATGGASEQTSKANLLAELFRPPIDLICPLPLADARDQGKEDEKWILVNVQDPSIFDCQVLNRDIWKNAQIRETVKEHFLFLQYNKDDPRGGDYVNYYFAANRDNEDAYPHIAIIDPRTGEQVKTWSGVPAPKASDFLMDLHEFLDRYSLNMNQKNPVQTKRKESKKDIGAMSEEEMLQMAMHASMANGSSAPKEEDPDALTRSHGSANGKGKAPSMEDDVEVVDAPSLKQDSPFSRISATKPHEEPTSTDAKQTTRIQFRYSGGRVIRRFELADPVRRIYEWLKASPIAGNEGKSFELISMNRNLIDQLDLTIDQAGLKQGTVMVEFVEDD